MPLLNTNLSKTCLFSLCKSRMLTWLALLGRCLHMSLFALAQELPLSPLWIHVNLVLNPALCYMRVPGSPLPSCTTARSRCSQAGCQPRSPGCQAGEDQRGHSSSTSWHVSVARGPSLHAPSSASQTISGVAGFQGIFPCLNPPLLESSDFVIIAASKKNKSKVLGVQMRYREKNEIMTPHLRTMHLISSLQAPR